MSTTATWQQMCGLGGVLLAAGAATLALGWLPVWSAGGLVGFGAVLLAAGLSRRKAA